MLLGWRPSLVVWRPLLLGWRPSSWVGGNINLLKSTLANPSDLVHFSRRSLGSPGSLGSRGWFRPAQHQGLLGPRFPHANEIVLRTRGRKAQWRALGHPNVGAEQVSTNQSKQGVGLTLSDFPILKPLNSSHLLWTRHQIASLST